MICPSCRHENTPGAEVCFTCRTVLTAVSQGTVLSSRYEIVRLVGRGGMGAVYRAHDRLLDEDVAIKILRADMATDPELAQRLRSEIKLARTVSHWNVCRVHEYGEDGPLRFISMELVEGKNLKELVQERGPLPSDEAFAVCVQAAQGLEAIHRAGIVHRDLTTANLMIDGAGRVRVMDFGIAKHTASLGAGTPYVVGSPEYMSPEQARGRVLDARSDLYALGVVAFELFTGRLPFKGDTPVATLLLHLEAEPPLAGEPAQRIPVALLPLLRRVLAKDPDARPATARAVAEELEAARAGSGVAAAPGSIAPGTFAPTVRLPVEDAREARPRDGRPRLVGASVALLALAFVVWRLLPPAAAPVAPSGSPSPLAVPASSAPTPLLSPGAEPSLGEEPAAIHRSPRPNPFASATPLVTSSPPPPALPVPSLPSPGAVITPEASPSPDSRPAAAVPAPSVTPSPAAVVQSGWLRLAVKPWADVTIDARPVGQTPLAAIELAPGPHAIVLTHPRYQPFPRRVVVTAGQTVRLVVDLAQDGVLR